MTLAGPKALRSLEEALRDIRREEDEIARRLSRSTELVTRIRETEGELLRQLAAIRLDPETQAELSGRLSRAEREAREMLSEHARALKAAEKELQAADKAIARLGAERETLAVEAAELEEELAALAAKASAQSAEDAEYRRLRDTARELQQVAEEALAKAAQAEADREHKGRPYRDDPLFSYLWARGYGTPDYRSSNLERWLDGMVARLVGYREARPNFAVLNEIPIRLREHAERQQEKAEAATATLLAREQEALDAAGGKPLREALAAAEARIAAIDAEIVQREDARDLAAQAQRELAEGRNPAFAAATAALAEGLGRADVGRLLAEARATSNAEDDTIVRQIDDARSRVQEEEEDIREQQARLKTLVARRRELEDIAYEFKRAGFDKPQSSFGEDDLVGDLLNDFLRGGISAADYWGRWHKSQKWQGGPWGRDPDRDDDRRRGTGSVAWPDSSFAGGGFGGFGGGNWGRLPRAGRGGGFSRPRSGSAGSRKHGGFKTGGGF